MSKVTLTAMVLTAVLLASGCGSDKESASRGISGGRSSSWSRNGESEKPENTMAMKAKKSDQGGELAKGPEDSMKRDLERLKSKERDQDKKVKDLRKSLSEGETLLAKEEGVLRDIRSGINDYNNALDKYASTGVKNRQSSADEEVVYQPKDSRQASSASDRGRREVSDDYDRFDYDDGTAYPKATVSGIPQPTHRNRSDFVSPSYNDPLPSPFRNNDTMTDAQSARQTQQYPDPMPIPAQAQRQQPVRRDLSPEPVYEPASQPDYPNEQTAASVPPAGILTRKQEAQTSQGGYQDAPSDVFVPDLYLGGN